MKYLYLAARTGPRRGIGYYSLKWNTAYSKLTICMYYEQHMSRKVCLVSLTVMDAQIVFQPSPLHYPDKTTLYMYINMPVHFQGYWERNAWKEMLYTSNVKTKQLIKNNILYQISEHQITLLYVIQKQTFCLRLHFCAWQLKYLTHFLSFTSFFAWKEQLKLPEKAIFHFLAFFIAQCNSVCTAA